MLPEDVAAFLGATMERKTFGQELPDHDGEKDIREGTAGPRWRERHSGRNYRTAMARETYGKELRVSLHGDLVSSGSNATGGLSRIPAPPRIRMMDRSAVSLHGDLVSSISNAAGG